ncbi:hypothetical protein ACU4GH_28690 [Bradyrhizobium betae]
MLGGFIFGLLSDRLRRVRVLAWSIVLFAVFTGLCALAQGYWDLHDLSGHRGRRARRRNSASAWRWSPRPGRRTSAARATSLLSVSVGNSACSVRRW